MQEITFADKSTGGSFTAADANEIKDVVNQNAGDRWDDVLVPILATVPKSTFEPTVATFGPGIVYGFDLNDEVYFNVQLPHRMKEGEDINFHLHGMLENTVDSETTYNFKFTLSYAWANINDDYGTSQTKSQQFTVNDVSNTTHKIWDMGDLTGTGKKISSILICNLKRIDDDIATEYPGEIYISSVDFHVLMDDRGSKFETSKT